MLQWFRAGARPIAAVAMLSLATLAIWSAAPHRDDCHDAICVPAGVPHDPSSHSVGRDTTNIDRPLHCVLCHWTRTSRPTSTTAHPIAPAVQRNVRYFVDLAAVPQTFVSAQPPLRAPPLSPVLAV